MPRMQLSRVELESVTGKQEVIGDSRDLEDKWFPTCVELSMFSFKADA
jgi:hypothetical protein